MKIEEFFRKLVDELELEDTEININSSLFLTSLRTMILITFLDEQFGIRVKTADLNGIDSIAKLIALIGNEKFE